MPPGYRSFLWNTLKQSRQFDKNLRSNSTSGPVPRPPRLKKHARRTGYLLVGLGTAYGVDKTYNASSIFRNLRTLWTCAMITLDYKWNFTPEKSEQIPQLHERVAQRMYDLMTSNGGLYIKIGQAIGANAAVLPQPMQVKFASLFDDAPQIPYSVVYDVFVKELGRPPSGPGGVFEIFEEEAVASASIAQVHKAKLWPRIGADGEPETEERWVAVKVQKPDVSTQMEWDLGAYRLVMWMFEHWAFDLPVYFVVDFISDHLRQELDFVREANNAQQTAEFVAGEPRLRDKVYIPKVYPEYSTKKVMVAEWIDGVRLSDKLGIFRLMGETPPDGTFSNIPTDPFSATALIASPPPTTSSVSSLQIPWKPLKGGVQSIMQTMVELFSAQMFDWGWVHCDPHPGNVLVRPSPSDARQPQLVLLDHGLYVRVPEDFKREWVGLWRAMLSGDYAGVEEVTRGWGFGLPDLMASFTLMRPTILRNGRKTKGDKEGNKKERKPLTQYEISVKMKAKLKEFLMDTDRMPKVLIFLTRNMRMVQGNNQSFGSPVNRIKITGYWASRSLTRNGSLSFSSRLKEWWRHLLFRAIMLRLDLTFWKTRFIAWARVWRARLHLGGSASGKDAGGFEEELEKTMRGFAKDSLGIEVAEDAFAG
ncbi:hypothetical protein GALMADRAFT_253465 [Galerina marginata CBS 339.88]|uniref:ABC1 atypical kinase-like domain-containing protein n=1 Tax=Galerina marginata (strain CBS 339.88) TaxID=685588 RepID=A0A067SVK1_GALM3|nr:hypothetical protein GALMADRAFT_253465 [Galerina marginata CBS 339.88]